MVWNVKNKPAHGARKMLIRFAWWPVEIAGKMVWLQRYYQVFEYQVLPRLVIPLFKSYKSSVATTGAWELIEEKITL